MHDLWSVKPGLDQGYELPFVERSGHKAQDPKVTWSQRVIHKGALSN